MTKQSTKSTITSLIVMPLIASAILLASPALASNINSTTYTKQKSATGLWGGGHAIQGKKGVIGVVTSVSGNSIMLKSLDGREYTVDATRAMVMKTREEPNQNPAVIGITYIKVGDTIMVRGTVNDEEISASKIFDGKMQGKYKKNLNAKRNAFLKQL